MKSRLSLASALVLPIAANAHDGHGLIPAQSVLHYLADPLHLAPLLVIAAAAWWVAKRRGKRS